MNYQYKDIKGKYFVLNKEYRKSDDYIKSPFRYPGGKFYALKYIIPFLNCVEHQEYREPFVGGGSVFFGKQKCDLNWINDLESQLITTYKAISNQAYCRKLIKEFKLEEATRERHKFYKKFEPINNYEIAKKTFYLNRTSYSGIIHKPAWGYKIGKSSPPENWHKFLESSHKKLQDMKITCLDFVDVIRAKPINSKNVVLMYLDPPYYHADTKRAYSHSFNTDDHKRLAKELKMTNHYFCLSYDDCEEIRMLYYWAYIYERNWFYNTANTTGKRMTGNELIITNYMVQDSLNIAI